MEAAGFVLAGGRSSRMGSDKALLHFRGRPLLAHVCDAVAAATGSAAIIGDPQRHAGLGYPVRPDLRPGLGPLAGIEAALESATAPWALVVACDMPRLEPDWLSALVAAAAAAENSAADVVVAVSPRGLEPLCALWRRRTLGAVRATLDAGERRVAAVLDQLQVVHFMLDSEDLAANVNTPADWERLLAREARG